MADLTVLSEIQNSQRQCRRGVKTYGKKKSTMAQTRAMHFDLFGRENENDLVSHMARMTVADTKSSSQPSIEAKVQIPSSPTVEIKAESAELNPKFRGRRKVLPSRKVAVLGQDKLDALKPLLSLVQGEVRDFFEFGKSMGKKYDCVKLGEGAFADVFKFKAKDLEESARLENYGGLVCKVIPFNIESSGRDDIADITSVTREIRTLFSLDPLPGFVRCRGAHVLSGKYPDILIDAFELYKITNPADAVNPDPSNAFPSDQLYVVIEMNDAGSPICNFKKLTAFEAFDTFWMTAMILHQAEQNLEFEHRDLHDGNICYRKKDKQATAPNRESLAEMTQVPLASVGLSGIAITVIDYTLARAKLKDGDDEIVVYDKIEFWDNNDAGSANAADQKQYDTYRQVRDLAKTVEEASVAVNELTNTEYQTVDKYQRFLPKSNVMWLGYLVMNLLLRRNGGRGDYVQGSSRVSKKVQLSMWKTLEAVDAYINKTTSTLLPASAGELLEAAVGKGWLRLADLEACKLILEE